MNVELSSTGAAYIRYSTRASAENLYVGGDESSEVIVDLDDRGAVIGIEIVDISRANDIARARAFAVEHGLPFPHDLSALIDQSSGKNRTAFMVGAAPDRAHALRRQAIDAEISAGFAANDLSDLVAELDGLADDGLEDDDLVKRA